MQARAVSGASLTLAGRLPDEVVLRMQAQPLRLRGMSVTELRVAGERATLRFSPGEAPSTPTGLLLNWLGVAWRVTGWSNVRNDVTVEYWGRSFVESPKWHTYRRHGRQGADQ